MSAQAIFLLDAATAAREKLNICNPKPAETRASQDFLSPSLMNWSLFMKEFIVVPLLF